MPLLDVHDLKVHFAVRANLLGARQRVRAVDGVSFQLEAGETLGLVGESGCGKSTLVRALIQLEPPSAGRIVFDGVDVSNAKGPTLETLRCGMQMVFQDPYGSLNPRLDAATVLDEVLKVHTRLNRSARRARVGELLALVGLTTEHGTRYPHEFSGGQRQRLGLARALAVNPKVLLADEPVAALDVSVQAQIVNLLQDLQERLGLACLFISHDLAVIEHICRRVMVMYLGRVVEAGDCAALFARPRHPYTKALLSAIPTLAPNGQRRIVLTGDVPSPVNPPTGCPFHPRCPEARAECAVTCPQLEECPDAAGHHVACLIANPSRGRATP